MQPAGRQKATASRRRASLLQEELQRRTVGRDDVVPAAVPGDGANGDPAAAGLAGLVGQLRQVLDLGVADQDDLGIRIAAAEEKRRAPLHAVAVNAADE